MLRGKFTNLIAEGILFQFFDLIKVKKYERLFNAMWKVGILNSSNLVITTNKERINQLFLDYRIFVVFLGSKLLEGQVEKYLDNHRVYVNMVRAISNRRELDEFISNHSVTYYMSNNDKDLFQRVIPGITSLQEIM